MNEQKVVQEILYMLYLFQKENGTMLKARPKPEEMNHREIMVLQAICRMHPDGTPVKMSDLSAFFQVTPAAVSQTIRAFERKEWVERGRPESLHPGQRKGACAYAGMHGSDAEQSAVVRRTAGRGGCRRHGAHPEKSD